MAQHETYIHFQMINSGNALYQMSDTLDLYFGLTGSTIITLGERDYVLEPAGIMLVNPYEICQLAFPDNAAVLILRISSRSGRRNPEQRHPIYRCYQKSDSGMNPPLRHIRELYASLFQDYMQSNGKSTSTGRHLTEDLLDMLSEHFINGTISKNQYVSAARIKPVLDDINEHWNENITLTRIAEKNYLSVGYLSRIFRQNLKISFSDYLRRVRIDHARHLLSDTEESVTKIAYECGFGSPSIFIEAFKQEFQCTPGQYRSESSEIAGERNAVREREHTDLSIVLDYIPKSKIPEELPTEVEHVSVIADVKGHLQKYAGRRILNAGYARDVLNAVIQHQICRAQREIGFEYIRFHGLLDSDMHIYSEDENGMPVLHFPYVDMLFDFVQSQNLTPYIEFGFMPPQIASDKHYIFDRPSNISGCSDLEKWNLLVRALLEHWIGRYGHSEVKKWRFATVSLSYVRVGCLTFTEFQALYKATWQTVKSVDSDLQFGGAGCFPDLINNMEIGVPAFLEFAKQEKCLPDFHSIQWYPCVQTDNEMFLSFTLSQTSAPAVLSTDPEYLATALDDFVSHLRKYHLEEKELFLEECSPTLWQRDLSSDTCYKAVWMAKNTQMIRDRAVFGYWLLSDLLEERADYDSIFHGGYGLLTWNDIPKAGYEALLLLSHLGTKCLAEGNGYLVTKKDGQIQLLAYNYVHYSDVYCLPYKRISEPENAYQVFRTGQNLSIRFRITGLIAGTYRIRRTKITRENGSSFDAWIRLGAPESPTAEETEYLRKCAEPQTVMEQKELAGSFRGELFLKPFEMELIELGLA